jgi:2-polyprenyl-6-methoxyphenol hydroxylase-like FAD-dependent oxidoreductase
MCPQDVVERILLARIATIQSIRLLRGVEVRGIDVHGDEVQVRTAEDNPLLARYVVGADGASSLLRQTCGPRMETRRGAVRTRWPGTAGQLRRAAVPGGAMER